MSSKKPSANAKRIEKFKTQLNDTSLADDIFDRENERLKRDSQERETALRKKTCESKNRYASRSDAEEAIALCAEHGTDGLHCYRCPYCNGWHLTSKEHLTSKDQPWEESL